MEFGLIEGMPNETYHLLEGISKSGLDKIARSPAHYKYSDQRNSTRAMVIGTAIHTAVLEPERFDLEYVVTDAKLRTESSYRKAKAACEFGGDYVLTKQEGKKILNMREAVHSNLEAAKQLFCNGRAELSAVVKDPETGVTIRARFDWLSDSGVAVDLKKTQDIRKFGKSVNDYRYHVQDAMYSFIYKQITGDDLQAFYFLGVEEEAPHSNQMLVLDGLAKEIGHFYFRRDLRTYADCIESGKWPHPGQGDGVIELPNWALHKYEDDLEVII